MSQGQNLVPNGDFESYSSCPPAGEIDSCLFWTNPSIGTPDFLHPCATNWFYSAPDNYYGYQQGHSGIAYGGIVPWGANVADWREYMEVTLSAPLQAGLCYQLEFYLSRADLPKWTADKIGAYFSDTLITGIQNVNPLPFTPQIEFNIGLNSDTISWIHLSGSFTAQGNENYMILGNYKNDAQTNIMQMQPTGIDYAYFLIDDVSLSPCTGIAEQNSGSFSISPNPFKNELSVKNYNNQLSEIIIFDITTKLLMRQEFSNSVTLNTSQLSGGIYFYEIRNKNGPDSHRVIRKGKIVKN